MRALIVYAHPEPLSFNAALRDAAAATLASLEFAVEVSDLYQQGFMAAASRDDFIRLANPERLSYAHEQRHAGRGYVAEILAEQEKLSRADLVVLQFPMWWYAAPSILKAWFDRVLSNGFAYADGQDFAAGLLRGKLAMVSTTTGGTREELDADSSITGTVEDVLRPITGGVFRFTGMTVLPSFVSYAPASMTHAQRAQELKRLELHLRSVLQPVLDRQLAAQAAQ